MADDGFFIVFDQIKSTEDGYSRISNVGRGQLMFDDGEFCFIYDSLLMMEAFTPMGFSAMFHHDPARCPFPQLPCGPNKCLMIE